MWVSRSCNLFISDIIIVNNILIANQSVVTLQRTSKARRGSLHLRIKCIRDMQSYDPSLTHVMPESLTKWVSYIKHYIDLWTDAFALPACECLGFDSNFSGGHWLDSFLSVFFCLLCKYCGTDFFYRPDIIPVIRPSVSKQSMVWYHSFFVHQQTPDRRVIGSCALGSPMPVKNHGKLHFVNFIGTVILTVC